MIRESRSKTCSFNEEDKEHDADTDGECYQLGYVHEDTLGSHHSLPHLRSDVDEVASHKCQDVDLNLFANFSQTQTNEHTDNSD